MQLDPGGAVDGTVEDCIREGGIVELPVLVADRELAGGYHRAPAEAIIEHLEEVACPRAVDRTSRPIGRGCSSGISLGVPRRIGTNCGSGSVEG